MAAPIWLVEPEQPLAGAIVDFLADDGFEVLLFDSLTAAVPSVLRLGQPSVVIVDLDQLVFRDGPAGYRGLSELSEWVPLVLMTDAAVTHELPIGAVLIHGAYADLDRLSATVRAATLQR